MKEMINRIVKKQNARFTYNIFDYLQLLVVASLFVMIFSASTSPLYPHYYGDDSAIFQLIGRCWAMGKIPYIDLFDHKGPVIFFVNMIGALLECLWGIQIFFLFFTMLGILNITSNYNIPKRERKIITILCVLYLLIFYTEGNLTEEYCLPFLTWSLAKQIKWLKEKKTEHNYSAAFFYGITFSVCLLTRITNVVICLTGICIIVINLINKNRWDNLIKNVASGIAGMLLPIMPFAIYFYLNNGLYDMFYGTILYNLDYVSSVRSMFFETLSMKTALIGLVTYFIFIACFILGVYKIVQKKPEGTFVLLMTLATGYMCLSGHSYVHYAIITIPMFAMFLCELYELIKDDTCKRIVCKGLICIYTVVALGWSMHIFSQNIVYPQIKSNLKNYSVSEELLDIIPIDEKDSVVFYNMAVSNYLAHNIVPCYTFFHHQDWQGSKSSFLMKKIITEFLDCEAKWIVVPAEECGITDILRNNYRLVKPQGDIEQLDYNLYKREY